MDVERATMAVPYFEALTAFKAYRTAVADKKATREDLMLYRSLRQLLRGKKVIDVSQAIGQAGRDSAGRPKLAIARADWPRVTCDGSGHRFIFTTSKGVWSARKPRGTQEVPVRLFPPLSPGLPPSHTIRCDALVPLIPPQHRPASDLKNYHLLFEADWNAPPVDPLLVQHIDGPFFVVLAAWDLTVLEQAVLRLR